MPVAKAAGYITRDPNGHAGFGGYNSLTGVMDDVTIDGVTGGLLVKQVTSGQAAAAASAPVALANEQVQDLVLNGAATQSALNNNILLASAGAGSVDTVAGASAMTYHSFTTQVNGGAGISAGAVTFEGSNDNTNFHSITVYDDNVVTGTPINAAVSIAASTSRFFSGKCSYRYIRCRISTAFVGGTVQAFSRISIEPYVPRVTTVGNPTAANHQVTNTPAAGTAHVLNSAATTNATSVKASAGTLFGSAISNLAASPRFFKLYNKASAPTVGTDIPVVVIPLPASSFVNFDPGEMGLRFSAGIAYAITGLVGDADTTAIAASDVKVFLNYL